METKYYLIENRTNLAKMSFDGKNYFDAFTYTGNAWQEGFPAELLFEGVEISEKDATDFMNGKIDSFKIVPLQYK